MNTDHDAEALAQAILTRRRRKCTAADNHGTDCQRCGTKEGAA